MYKREKEKRGIRPVYAFTGLILAACMLMNIPFLHIPFSWMQTFFHEISHGLTAVITGGKIVHITLNVDGSGLCTSLGGARFWIIFSGYMGAIFWGWLIYIIATNMHENTAFFLALLIIALMLICMVFWAYNLTTVCILIAMIVPFILALKLRQVWFEKLFLRFSGVYIMLDAVLSPLHLLGISDRGDDFALQELTGLPQIFWVGSWSFAGCLVLLLLFRAHMRSFKA